MKQSFLVMLLLLLVCGFVVFGQDKSSEMSVEEKEKLRQELMDIQRQITGDYVRLWERMRSSLAKIKDLENPVDRANYEKLQRAIKLMEDLKIEVDMRNLEKFIKDKTYLRAMTLAKEISSKLNQVLKELDSGEEYREDDRIEDLQKAIEKLDQLSQEQKDIEEKTEETFKNSAAKEYQDQMRDVEGLIKQQEDLKKDTESLSSEMNQVSEAIKNLDKLLQNQEKLSEKTTNLKEGKTNSEKLRLSALEEALKKLDEIIREQVNLKNSTENPANTQELYENLEALSEKQTKLISDAKKLENNNESFKAYNDLRELEENQRKLFAQNSAAREVGEKEADIAAKLAKPQENLKLKANTLVQTINEIVRANSNEASIRETRTFLQNSLQEIELAVERFAQANAEDAAPAQERSVNALVSAGDKMMTFIKILFPDFYEIEKSQENLIKEAGKYLKIIDVLAKRRIDSTLLKALKTSFKNITSASLSMKNSSQYLQKYSTRKAENDQNQAHDSLIKAVDTIKSATQTTKSIEAIKLKEAEQKQVTVKVADFKTFLSTISVKDTSEADKKQLKDIAEQLDSIAAQLPQNVSNSVKYAVQNLKDLLNVANQAMGKSGEFEKGLKQASIAALTLKQEFDLEGTPVGNELSASSLRLSLRLDEMSQNANTRVNANRSLDLAKNSMIESQENLVKNLPNQSYKNQKNAIENLENARKNIARELEKSLNKQMFAKLAKEQDKLEKEARQEANNLDKLAQNQTSKNAQEASEKTRDAAKEMKKASENMDQQQSSKAQQNQKKAKQELNEAKQKMSDLQKDLKKSLEKKSQELAKKQKEIDKKLKELSEKLDQSGKKEADKEKQNMVDKAKDAAKKASENMKKSEKKLNESKPTDSEPHQKDAIEKLKDVKEELKKLAEKSLNEEEKYRYEKLQQDQKNLEKKTEELKKDIKDKSPKAEEKLDEAKKKMRESEKQLGKQQGGSAKQKQKEAKKKLDEAKKELEKLLREYEKEQNSKLLLHIEQEIEKMLKGQIKINQKTRTINADVAESGRLDRKTRRQIKNLGDDQKELADLADKLVEKMTAGHVPIFASVTKMVSDDMKKVTKELKRSNTDEYVQEIQEDILTRLKDLLASLRAERKRRQEQPDPPSGGGC